MTRGINNRYVRVDSRLPNLHLGMNERAGAVSLPANMHFAPRFRTFSGLSRFSPSPSLSLRGLLLRAAPRAKEIVSGLICTALKAQNDERIHIRDGRAGALESLMLADYALLFLASRLFPDLEADLSGKGVEAVINRIISVESCLLDAGVLPFSEQREALAVAEGYLNNYLMYLRTLSVPVVSDVSDLAQRAIFVDGVLLGDSAGSAGMFYDFLALHSSLTGTKLIEVTIHEALHLYFPNFVFSQMLNEGFTQYMTREVLRYNGAMLDPAGAYHELVEMIDTFVNGVLNESTTRTAGNAFFAGRSIDGMDDPTFRLASMFDVSMRALLALLVRRSDPLFVGDFIRYGAYMRIRDSLAMRLVDTSSFSRQLDEMGSFIENFNRSIDHLVSAGTNE